MVKTVSGSDHPWRNIALVRGNSEHSRSSRSPPDDGQINPRLFLSCGISVSPTTRRARGDGSVVVESSVAVLGPVLGVPAPVQPLQQRRLLLDSQSVLDVHAPVDQLASRVGVKSRAERDPLATRRADAGAAPDGALGVQRHGHRVVACPLSNLSVFCLGATTQKGSLRETRLSPKAPYTACLSPKARASQPFYRRDAECETQETPRPTGGVGRNRAAACKFSALYILSEARPSPDGLCRSARSSRALSASALDRGEFLSALSAGNRWRHIFRSFRAQVSRSLLCPRLFLRLETESTTRVDTFARNKCLPKSQAAHTRGARRCRALRRVAPDPPASSQAVPVAVARTDPPFSQCTRSAKHASWHKGCLYDVEIAYTP